LDAAGEVVAEADVIVLAAARDTLRLLGGPAWPLADVRGQVTRLPAGAVPAPSLPVAGAGYAIALPGGGLLCGATSQPGDTDPVLRDHDHRHNLERLARLLNTVPDAVPLDGRVGWRLLADDRLPVVGAVPQAAPLGGRLDQPRLVPREPGLFVHTALGSRGIAWAALCAQSLAAGIAGVPSPMESSLLDAIDPARFVARAVRRSAS
jgi:tRNA 5-methylaminomethyl-2-thiouridine biosynthesis bifunctional protein